MKTTELLTFSRPPLVGTLAEVGLMLAEGKALLAKLYVDPGKALARSKGPLTKEARLENGLRKRKRQLGQLAIFAIDFPRIDPQSLRLIDGRMIAAQ